MPDWGPLFSAVCWKWDAPKKFGVPRRAGELPLWPAEAAAPDGLPNRGDRVDGAHFVQYFTLRWQAGLC